MTLTIALLLGSGAGIIAVLFIAFGSVTLFGISMQHGDLAMTAVDQSFEQCPVFVAMQMSAGTTVMF